jgi:hypothetical protein
MSFTDKNADQSFSQEQWVAYLNEVEKATIDPAEGSQEILTSIEVEDPTPQHSLRSGHTWEST